MFVKNRYERRKRKKAEGSYTFWDVLGDILIWVPELIIWPFRLLWYMIRGIFSFFDWF